MNKIIITVILLVGFISTNSFGQLNDNAMVGTWEAELSNNRIFRIVVFEVTQGDENYLSFANLQGHFTMIQLDSNGNESTIYTSNRDMCDGCNMNYPPALWLNTDGGSQVSGFINDNSSSWQVSDGYIKINYIENNPLKVSWLVHQDGSMISRPARPLNIPTDLILTKQ